MVMHYSNKLINLAYTILSVPCIWSVYRIVRAILSVQFCQLLFCPRTLHIIDPIVQHLQSRYGIYILNIISVNSIKSDTKFFFFVNLSHACTIKSILCTFFVSTQSTVSKTIVSSRSSLSCTLAFSTSSPFPPGKSALPCISKLSYFLVEVKASQIRSAKLPFSAIHS